MRPYSNNYQPTTYVYPLTQSSTWKSVRLAARRLSYMSVVQRLNGPFLTVSCSRTAGVTVTSVDVATSRDQFFFPRSNPTGRPLTARTTVPSLSWTSLLLGKEKSSFSYLSSQSLLDIFVFADNAELILIVLNLVVLVSSWVTSAASRALYFIYVSCDWMIGSRDRDVIQYGGYQAASNRSCFFISLFIENNISTY